ncbi:hypothetical protein [uncultured Tateyamaria sp.]|uniref:hypothetical protein n=1 Tax=uncultured Tateyamaria sp. TaxID=455651 RepID=UPI00260886D2|nr:hypothetical protein [uncultured Tateyamaria sp.]
MSSSVKALFDQAIHPESPYLKLLQERGLVRQELSSDDLRSESVRDDAVEQALILFAADTERAERQEILDQLQHAQREAGVEIPQVQGFERTASREAAFRQLEVKAEEIWTKAMEDTRSRSSDVSATVSDASVAISEKNYDVASDLLSAAEREQSEIEDSFKKVYMEARRGLRREYNAEFASRVWDNDAQQHFDTQVNRSVFVPPNEMRQSAQQIAEVKQHLVTEKSYSTELEKRVGARPERSPSQGMKR